MRQTRASALAVAVPVVVALLLTVPFLTHAPLWADEVDSVDAAVRPWGDLLHLLSHQDAPLGLYYAGLHLWTAAAGTSEAVVRLPSVLGAAAAVGLLAETGRRVAGPVAGLTAGLVLATNPFVASYALDTRPYALELACGTGLLLLVASAPTRPGVRRQAAYGALLVVGTGLHLFLLLAVPAHLLGLRIGRRPLRPWLAPAGIAVLVVSPLLLRAAGQTAEVGYLHRPGALSPLGWLQAMAGGTPWVAVPLLVVAAVLGRSARRHGGVLALTLLLLPGAVLLVVSTVHPLFLNRYVLPSTAGLALLVGVGVARSGRAAGAVASGVVALAVLATVLQQGHPYRYEDLRAGADVVLDSSRSTDAIVYAPATVRAAASYYLSRADRRDAPPLDVTASVVDERAAGNFGGRDALPGPAVRAVAARARVWRLSWADGSARRTAVDRSVLELLTQRYALVSRTRLGHLVVDEYQRLVAQRGDPVRP